MKVGSMVDVEGKNKSYSKYYILAVVLAIVGFIMLTFVYTLSKTIVLFIIKYWYIAILLFLIILWLWRRRKK